MRKLIDFVLLWCLFYGTAFGQATNPQNTFANAVNVARPSLWLNFNDPTTAFKDQVTQTPFVNTETGTTIVTHSPTPPAAAPNGNTYTGAFDGSTTYLTTASVSTLTPPAYTFAAWVYLASLPASGGYATLLGNTGAPEPDVLVESTGYLVVSVPASSGTPLYFGGSHALTANTWYFLALTYSSTAGLVGYVNGAVDGTAAAAGTMTPITGSMVLGGDYPCCGGRYLNGQISNAMVYNTALTSTQINTLYTGGTISSGLIGQWQINEGTGTTAIDSSTGGNNMTWVGTASGNFGYYWGPATTTIHPVYTSGPVTSLQPGFDATNNANFSAAFPYNGFNAAPNNTLGSIEWNVPWSMLIHVDRLNWDHTGTLVLASKGDGTPSWSLTLRPSPSNANESQLCFYRSGVGAGYAQQHVCTNDGYDAMPNGFNYDIVVEDSGTGNGGGAESGTPALSMWLNGLSVGTSGTSSDTYSTGFGNVTLAVTAGGSGYAATTGFTSTGGGANCVVTGYAYATSGVITSIASPTGNTNSGCTSDPQIVLTSPTGTGATFTATAAPMTMNSTTAPLMVPGSFSGGAYYGVGGADSAQNPVYLDEFAIFPGNLTFGQIGNLFDTTKFYQSVVNIAVPKPVMVVDEDGFGDSDDIFTVQMGIGMHRAGIVTLAGIVSEDGQGATAAAFRQMLDSAGLNDVPVSTPVPNMSASTYVGPLVTSYNASTSQAIGSYEDSTTMYRTIFAKYPTTPIDIVMGGTNWQDMAQFMQSAADSISPLTGLQMIAQNGANGGAIYGQGSLWDVSANGEYVVSHNQSMPIIWIGGTPASGGPGPLTTRTSNDILWLWFNSVGTDVRQCDDCLMTEAVVSSLFDFGVTITYSGGTGYAKATPFTLSGGGPHCQGSGIMTAASGVPNGIEFSWGQSASGLPIGSGCMSTPIVNLIGSTGTGVTLTATPTPCGTFTVPTIGTYPPTYSTATCSNQYVVPGSFNTNQTPVSGELMTWFINSLVDGSTVGAPRVP